MSKNIFDLVPEYHWLNCIVGSRKEIFLSGVRDRIGSVRKSVFIPKEPPIFCNGNDDLFLKPPLTPIVKISTACTV